MALSAMTDGESHVEVVHLRLPSVMALSAMTNSKSHVEVVRLRLLSAMAHDLVPDERATADGESLVDTPMCGAMLMWASPPPVPFVTYM